ncbi:hypothetical protein ACLVWU_04190 [Bdellovibrio sp. HCB290]|uniref:hypothetical protein n=1 Tax=Bdellovibrio sp. HCB290 TaxID=3394356 RepID=UPI0039B4E24D
MKFIIALMLTLTASLATVAAPGETDISPDDLTTDADGNFVICTLKDGRQFQSTTWLVAIDNLILSKEPVRAYLNATSENLEFKSWEFRVLVTKPFAADGVRSVQVTRLKPSEPTQYLECAK